ncbi:MAG: ubiquinone/menaquinone biosynthesis methyltransferase [Eubacteriales bacterium]|nr:ubiquinone/menaquinone biosynthesis methyltransferase [Eubacteriales bacterium]
MNQQEKKEHVYDVFQTIAERYDSANARISLGLEKRWKALLVKRLTEAAGPGQKVLDVCCGTGDIAIAIAGERPDLAVTGLDFSPAMLEAAREKGGSLPNLQLMQGDAMELPFPDNTFAAVCISFGLRNTADYSRVLNEMYRTVMPGGRVFCLDSFVPDNPMVVPAYEVYFRHLMPVLGGGRKYKKQYEWLYTSTQQFPGRRKIMKLFAKTGLRQVQSRSRMLGACVLVEGTKPH